MSLELLRMLPRDKHDVQRAEALVLLGYPAVEPILPQLLQWAQDGNWPVARVLAPLLAAIGLPLVPHVRLILNGNDDTWKYFLLQTVVAESVEMKRLLHPELERLARCPTASEAAEELDSMASTMLAIP
ncbi:hypothetical protein J2X19_000734 [Rhodoferax ferrireducens]|uniref:DUF5071 domain-containing protein n=1 Tax=Rhodoferax ferrireducens TaxID=192843 RepID=A0ABU2C408_9BURK|nr:DUF5071 domain-containing protein [Rhodoferax ferrireducens]MDR7376076.1 hypothetical protein [Rhodoferax ferrireducens]